MPSLASSSASPKTKRDSTMDQATTVIKLETVLSEVADLKDMVSKMSLKLDTVIQQNETIERRSHHIVKMSDMLSQDVEYLVECTEDLLHHVDRQARDYASDRSYAEGEILKSDVQLSDDDIDGSLADDAGEAVHHGDDGKAERHHGSLAGTPNNEGDEHEQGENEPTTTITTATATAVPTEADDAVPVNTAAASESANPVPPTPRTAWKTNKNPNDGPVRLHNLVTSRSHHRLAALTVIDPTLAADGKVRAIGPIAEPHCEQDDNDGEVKEGKEEKGCK